jgi:hypothetical protein
MAEQSGHWTTDAVSPEGHQVASYSQAINTSVQMVLAGCNDFEGVAPTVSNALAGTVTDTEEVTIAEGGALVDGKWYINPDPTVVAIPAAGGGKTRIDRIVLRVSWAAFTVLITRIAGVESAGTPTAPAITQTSGTTYDIMLYQALVNSSGTVTLTDERLLAAPHVARRQGGSATLWNTAGTTNYVPAKTIIQCGAVAHTAASTDMVTFPIAFSHIPIVLVSCHNSNAYIATAEVITATNFQAWAYKSADQSDVTATVYWIAVGPIA